MVLIIPKLYVRCSAHIKSNVLKNSLAVPKIENQSEISANQTLSSELKSTPLRLMRTWNRSQLDTAVGTISNTKSNCRSADRRLNEQITKWLVWDRNPITLAKMKAIVKTRDWDKLRACLMERLKFGNEGLRAKMDAGFNAMNDLVVIQTAQGLCAYLKKQYPDQLMWFNRGIAIGYDARFNSQRYANLTAAVFVINNFRTYLFQRYVPVSFVPYTILRLNCLAGVMITASDSAKQYNGLKVYWTNGAQITSSHEYGIEQSILENLEPLENVWNPIVLANNELLSDPYEYVVPAYFDALKREIPRALLVANGDCSLSVTYTALHGVGFDFINMVFPKLNLDKVIPVPKQIQPNPKFPTSPLPNLAEGNSVLQLAIETAISNESDLILANDPAAVRLVVGELGDEGKYIIFTGNELSALLAWWALELYKLNTPKPELGNCVMIGSIMCSKILKCMAQVEGFTFNETAIGFKWIAHEALKQQQAGRKVLFAFEEAKGYKISSIVPDQDGISAAVHVVTMASYLRCTKFLSLQEKLRELYEKYGYHVSFNYYMNCQDMNIVQNIFSRLRNFNNKQKDTYPKSILNGEFKVYHIMDYKTGYDSSTPKIKAILPVGYSHQMITFTFQNGFVISLNYCKEESKLKYYAEMSAKPTEKRWSEMQRTAQRMTMAAINEFYEPEKNGLDFKAQS